MGLRKIEGEKGDGSADCGKKSPDEEDRGICTVIDVTQVDIKRERGASSKIPST